MGVIVSIAMPGLEIFARHYPVVILPYSLVNEDVLTMHCLETRKVGETGGVCCVVDGTTQTKRGTRSLMSSLYCIVYDKFSHREWSSVNESIV